jgi:hypothetical protein
MEPPLLLEYEDGKAVGHAAPDVTASRDLVTGSVEFVTAQASSRNRS